MKKVIDCYGWPSTSEFYMQKKKTAFEIRTVGSKTFVRFDNKAKCAIWCLDETSGTKLAWNYGTWASAESLTYTADLATPLTIEEN
jgi:hypothetical protein